MNKSTKSYTFLSCGTGLGYNIDKNHQANYMLLYLNNNCKVNFNFSLGYLKLKFMFEF